jgi:hypothetical protein
MRVVEQAPNVALRYHYGLLASTIECDSLEDLYCYQQTRGGSIENGCGTMGLHPTEDGVVLIELVTDRAERSLRLETTVTLTSPNTVSF